MSATPPSRPRPATSQDPLRTAANRRILIFISASVLLFIGALWLAVHKETLTVVPTLPPPLTEEPTLDIPKPTAKPIPLPTPPPVVEPTSPALDQSAQMEVALVAYREASEHLIAKRFDPAEERALAALTAYPKMASAQRILGLIYLQQGRVDRAITVLEESLRNEPLHPEALTHLAFAYLQNQNPGLAMELIETCRRIHPDYKPALIQQGLMLLSQPDSQEAVDVLREAVAAFPSMPGPRNNLAVALARRGDREGAREQLSALIEIDPNNFSALFNTGALYAQETNAPAALPFLRRAMAQMNPSNFRTYLNDPDLAPIRESTEFKQLLEELDPLFPVLRPPQ